MLSGHALSHVGCRIDGAHFENCDQSHGEVDPFGCDLVALTTIDVRVSSSFDLDAFQDRRQQHPSPPPTVIHHHTYVRLDERMGCLSGLLCSVVARRVVMDCCMVQQWARACFPGERLALIHRLPFA